MRAVIESNQPSIPAQSSYSDTYPPMPFIIYRFLVFQIGEEYRFSSRDFGLDVRAGDASRLTEIVFAQTKDGRYTLTVDGKDVANGEGRVISKGDYRLNSDGSGRDWSGTIRSLNVISADGTVLNLLAN